MNKSINALLLSAKRKLNFKKLDNILRKGNPDTIDQLHMDNLKLQAARVQFYVDTFIPSHLQESFYDVLQDYADWHDRIAITEMRRAVKENAFAPAVEARAEGGDAAATISIGMSARHPDLKMKDLIRKIEDERERVLGFEHRTIDRSTVHRHLKRVGESRRRQ